MDQAYERLHERGARIRESVLGSDWVERSADAAASFGEGYQDVAKALAWGGIWARDGLSLRDRSLVTLAALATLGRQEELQAHILGAVRNGLGREEIEEAFIHVGLYAGFPAAVGANRAGQAVFGALDDDDVDAPQRD